MGLRFCHSGKMAISFWQTWIFISQILKKQYPPTKSHKLVFEMLIASAFVLEHSHWLLRSFKHIITGHYVLLIHDVQNAIGVKWSTSGMPFAYKTFHQYGTNVTTNGIGNLQRKPGTKNFYKTTIDFKWSFWSRKRSLGYKLRQSWSSRTL